MPDRVVVFDTNCLLCSKFIRLLLNNDSGQLHYTGFDSSFAKTNLPNGLRITPETVVFLHQEHVFIKSQAIFEILRFTGKKFRWLRVFRVFPVALLDKIYDWVAGNRYSWFGKLEQCFLPTKEQSARFLD